MSSTSKTEKVSPEKPQNPGVRTTIWKRLGKFLLARGSTAQPNGVWPVNYADAVDFTLEEITRVKRGGVKIIKDPAVNVLQEVRRLRHTCPGCDKPIDLDPVYMIGHKKPLCVGAFKKKGEFLWHESCLASPWKDDLRHVVTVIKACTVDATPVYHLKVMASQLRDKYGLDDNG